MGWFWIHCRDCGEHSEIRSKDTQEFCGCSSIDWHGCDASEPGECEECDEIMDRDEEERREAAMDAKVEARMEEAWLEKHSKGDR